MHKREEPEHRPTPEELLAKVMRAERQEKRGRLKIFLGFAAGVGKTYEMLCEANRRKQRGQDVIIGYIETHKRQGTEEQLGDLETLPRKQIPYRGTTLEEMDTDAILQRKPHWVLVDEFAHTNAPGSDREKRWQDVEDDVSAYRKEKHVTNPWNTQDRIMVCISPDHSSMRLVRRGWRISQRLHAEIHEVEQSLPMPPWGSPHPSPPRKRLILSLKSPPLKERPVGEG